MAWARPVVDELPPAVLDPSRFAACECVPETLVSLPIGRSDRPAVRQTRARPVVQRPAGALPSLWLCRVPGCRGCRSNADTGAAAAVRCPIHERRWRHERGRRSLPHRHHAHGGCAASGMSGHCVVRIHPAQLRRAPRTTRAAQTPIPSCAVSAWRGGQPALGVARPMIFPRRAGLYMVRTDSRGG